MRPSLPQLSSVVQSGSIHVALPVVRAHRTARGFTLIEMLVSLTITLIMMGAVVTLFQTMTDSVSGSRALIELSDRMRNCRNRLQTDLIGATATMLPPMRPEDDAGYMEIIDGPAMDSGYSLNGAIVGSTAGSLFGDVDDVLMFTVRSRGEPFVGKLGATALESQTAEVIYFLTQTGNEPIIDPSTPTPTRLFTLFRRVLLVAPGLTASGLVPAATSTYYDFNDLSARYVSPSTMVPNSLGDLTKRENRFAHYGTTFPFNVINTDPAVSGNQPVTDSALHSFTGVTRLGDDVILSNVLAFDVQVWDPNAPVLLDTTNNIAVEPSHPGVFDGYPTPLSLSGSPLQGTRASDSAVLQLTSYGAYVDLGYKTGLPAATVPVPMFYELSLRPTTPNGAAYLNTGSSLPVSVTNGARSSVATYDTWSLSYENDGIDQNGDGKVDGGTNGIDDNGNGVVDESGNTAATNEFDTQAPFAAQLRGLRITVRCYEPASQQVREFTVVQDFLAD